MALRKRGSSLLFDDSKGHHRNDTITLNRNFSPYGSAFHRAASSLAKPFLEGRGNFLNSDGLPVVYLYRHALARFPIDKRSKRPPLESYAYTLEGFDDFFGYSVNKFVEIIDPLVELLGGFAAQLEDWEKEQEEEPSL